MSLRIIGLTCVLSLFSLSACKPTPRDTAKGHLPPSESETTVNEIIFVAPDNLPSALIESMNTNMADFLKDLDAVLEADTENLLFLVDKKHPLSNTYVPHDLIALDNSRSYRVSRDGFSLRTPVEAALELMAAGARQDGITLLVSSTYRSFAYQETVFNRNVRELGEKEAERESARPGTSQHQLGTVVDFGSITDAFAKTAAGKWLDAHAHEYGWSLSFPAGYEHVTGYRWESWHFRYIGKEAASFQKKWFDDIQQYMIEFLDFWKRNHK